MNLKDPLGVREVINVNGQKINIYRLEKLEAQGYGKISKFPYSLKILLESILRQIDGELIMEENIRALANWTSKKIPLEEIPFIPARVILQDFTGVPAVVDLAAMRSAMARAGGNPKKINPLIPVDLIIDHSIQVDYYGTDYARKANEVKEFERNKERYSLLRWAQNSFENFRVVPPGQGIIHQINLEYLSSIIQLKKVKGDFLAYPDSLVGTDSHTTMINGIGVLGWGVGGIEAEAAMLGQPLYIPIPEVVGVKLTGKLEPFVTATDLVLTITQRLREYGVVGKFVEFYGPGIQTLSLPERATISNMAPEYGATIGYFPIDEETIKYLILTGRGKYAQLVKVYGLAQGIFFMDESTEPEFNSKIELDLSKVEPSLAGPKRPQDRIPLKSMKEQFHKDMKTIFKVKLEIKDRLKCLQCDRWRGEGGSSEAKTLAEMNKKYRNWLEEGGSPTSNYVDCKFPHLIFEDLMHGSIVIAAITSCTNTSNPFVLIGAGLLAKNAVKRGLRVKPFIKTSLAPGSRVVVDYLREANLLPYLEALGFHVVGYGCTSCIGNSGPIPRNVAKVIEDQQLVVASILCGNRNFEGRINPLTRVNYLASPPLVVAYAIAGSIDINLMTEPLGYDPNGQPVFLKDIWPTRTEIEQIVHKVITPEMFTAEYSKVFEGTQIWKELKVATGEIYQWTVDSTYIQEPPFFKEFSINPPPVQNIIQARVLVYLGDSITTDHISPAGAIPASSPAGQFLISNGVSPNEFNSFGSRRGNHEVMMRGTFGNIRLQNKLVPEKEGNWTRYFPTGEILSVYEAAMNYQRDGTPLIILAGKEYGTGSSRDWAAKGTFLLGVKAVIAESYERIHRSNLVGMGVLPLQFELGQSAESLGLTGEELFDITGMEKIQPKGKLTIKTSSKERDQTIFNVTVRLDSPIELEYYRNGGILHTVLRNLIKS
ncbi:MAG: aconitate hydratase [Candidatus Helarchaeota archaeon]